jgi:hypothetical protein
MGFGPQAVTRLAQEVNKLAGDWPTWTGHRAARMSAESVAPGPSHSPGYLVRAKRIQRHCFDTWCASARQFTPEH